MAMPAGTRTLQTRKDSDTEAWARRVGAAVGRASVWGHTGRARPAWPWRGLRDVRSARAERLGVVFNAGFVVTLRLRFPLPELSVISPHFINDSERRIPFLADR